MHFPACMRAEKWSSIPISELKIQRLHTSVRKTAWHKCFPAGKNKKVLRPLYQSLSTVDRAAITHLSKHISETLQKLCFQAENARVFC